MKGTGEEDRSGEPEREPKRGTQDGDRCDRLLGDAGKARTDTCAESDLLEQAVDDHVGGDAFGLGGEVRDDAVAQHRVGDRGHVLGGDVRAAVDRRVRLGTQDQVLARARTGSPGDPLFDEERTRVPRANART